MLRKFPYKIFPWHLWLILVALPFLWITFASLGWLQSLEYITLNWRFVLRGNLPITEKLIYVEVDSDALDAMGEQPVPRAYFAKATRALFDQGNAKTVGIDILFSHDITSPLVDQNEIEKDNHIMAQVIKDYPNLVLAGAYAMDEDQSYSRGLKFAAKFPYIYLGFDENSSSPELPDTDLTRLASPNVGIINLAEHYSPGSIPRWAPMYAKTQTHTYFNIALQMASIYLDIPTNHIDILDDQILLKNQNNVLVRDIPLADKQLLEINWISKWMSPGNFRVNFLDVLSYYKAIQAPASPQYNEAQAFFKQFEGAAILIGITDPLLNNLTKTPFGGSSVPKMSANGNLFKTIVSDNFLIRPSSYIEYSIVLLLTALTLVMGIYPSRWGGWLKVASAAALLFYLFLTYILFANVNWVLPVIAPACAAISTTFLGVVYQLGKTEKQRVYIQQLFGTYVSPDLVDQMVQKGKEPQLGGVEENISALFSDVESFTAIAEKLSPKQVVDLMNEYLTAMTQVIQEERGTLDKYIGDAVVAMFGAPLRMSDHALAACRTACRMHQTQQELCKKWQSEGDKWPDFVKTMRTRVGINTGPAVIGNMGSSTRFNYTMMGDHVNLASRCETASVGYSVYSMTTEHTRANVEKISDEILFRYIDRMIVRGKSQPVPVHQIVGFKKDQPQEAFECVGIYEEALQHYFDQNWEKAIKGFEKAASLESYLSHYQRHNESASRVFKLRCEILKNHPERSAWNGVFKLDSN